jgi:hypothetical protein
LRCTSDIIEELKEIESKRNSKKDEEKMCRANEIALKVTQQNIFNAECAQTVLAKLENEEWKKLKVENLRGAYKHLIGPLSVIHGTGAKQPTKQQIIQALENFIPHYLRHGEDNLDDNESEEDFDNDCSELEISTDSEEEL